jgi:hypothetical protein
MRNTDVIVQLADAVIQQLRVKRSRRPLNEAQRCFVATHYKFALRVARRAFRRRKVNARRVEDQVEDIAVSALLAFAKRSTEPEFEMALARWVIATVVSREVKNTLAQLPC